jgi:hypothetical protein
LLVTVWRSDSAGEQNFRLRPSRPLLGLRSPRAQLKSHRDLTFGLFFGPVRIALVCERAVRSDVMRLIGRLARAHAQ